jgi:LmbE family N-acetylglucosaminyl deacetylase
MIAKVRAHLSKARVYELLNPKPVRNVSGDISGRLLRRFAATMPVTDAPALVVAPHQDDETLGCGGLIALKRRRAVPVHVVFTTDGRGGEPTTAPPEAVVAARHAEALAALTVLDVAEEHVHFLSGEDGRLRDFAGEERATIERELDAVLDAVAPAEVFVTYQYDNHPDHRATFELVTAAVARATERQGRTIALYQYPIWGFWQNPLFHRFRHRRVRGFVRVDVSSVLDRKARALDPYDGQLRALPKLIRRQALWDHELYLPVSPDAG